MGEKSYTIKKYFTFAAVLFASIFLCNTVTSIVIPCSETVSTKQGTFKALKSEKEIYDSFFDYINSHNPNNEAILGLPEGLFFNFILKNKTKLFPTSFTPMDFDSYGEDYLISKVLDLNPKIIFFIPRNTGDYGREHICEDYGQKFCSVVLQKYKSNFVLEGATPAVRFVFYERRAL